jgi:hypothetical protein
MAKIYQPYFEAVKQILEGTPVQELDDISQNCNEAFLKTKLSKTLKQAKGHTPKSLIVNFLVEAENKILMGITPIEAYKGFEEAKIVNFRQRGRKILENTVQQYFE